MVIADFGIARFEQDELYTAVETKNERLANFVYSAPEQRQRGKETDERSDVFALGLMLNELFTGEVAHGTAFKTVASVDAAHSWVDDVVTEMIRSAPSDRPASIAEVRERLRLHSELFSTRQKISELSKQVVAAGTIDDTLAVDPPRIIGVDYDENTLTIRLDKPVNAGWIEALRNMGGYRSMMGAGPSQFHFAANVASVSIAGHYAQAVIDTFKEWLPQASQQYAYNLANAAQAQEQREREAIRQQRARLEERQRILSNLRF